MPGSNNNQALKDFKDNIGEFISGEFARYRQDYINSKTKPDEDELKQNLRNNFVDYINVFLKASDIDHKLNSREQCEKLKQTFVKDEKKNDPDIEEKIDEIIKPYLKCLDNLDKEIDKTAKAITKNVESERKTDKIVKGVCIALSVIALGAAAFATAGVILGIPAVVAATYSIALACTGSGVVSAIKSGLSSSSSSSLFTSLLQKVGIMKKPEVKLDEETLKSITDSISHSVKQLPTKIENLKKEINDIKASVPKGAVIHSPEKPSTLTKKAPDKVKASQDKREKSEDENLEGLSTQEKSALLKKVNEVKKADKKVRDITAKRERKIALKHRDKIHHKHYHRKVAIKATEYHSPSRTPNVTPKQERTIGRR